MIGALAFPFRNVMRSISRSSALIPARSVWEAIRDREARSGSKRRTHGIGTKASDYQTMPLCRSCHHEQGRMDIALFEATFHINPYRVSFTILVEWHVIQMDRWREAEQRRIG